MKSVFVILKNALRQGKMFILLAAAGGILLCFLFQLFTGTITEEAGAIHVGLIDEDVSAVSSDLGLFLEEDLGMDVILSGDLDAMKTALIEKDISAIIIVPTGFEASLLTDSAVDLGKSVETIFADDYVNSAFTRGYLENYTVSLVGLAAAAAGDADKLKLLLKETRTGAFEVKTLAADQAYLDRMQTATIFRVTLGFYLIIVFLLAIGFTNMIFSDRADGRYQRIRGSHIPPVAYISGMCLFGFIGAALMIGVYMLYVRISGTQIGIPYGEMFILCFAFGLFVVAFSLVSGLYLPSRNSILACIIGVSTITSMLGGAYFNIDTAPIFMQQLARFTPQFWFMDAVDATVRGESDNWGTNALIIFLFALLCFILSGVKFASNKPARKIRSASVQYK
ncbi:MAG: ABC transporter permease [Clostridiales Family XIII bacterium]|jgi:ABC-2 type transport system permease protein|nr:ABC transporter permease [Clostridiales Family XIII bacterium]